MLLREWKTCHLFQFISIKYFWGVSNILSSCTLIVNYWRHVPLISFPSGWANEHASWIYIGQSFMNSFQSAQPHSCCALTKQIELWWGMSRVGDISLKSYQKLIYRHFWNYRQVINIKIVFRSYRQNDWCWKIHQIWADP